MLGLQTTLTDQTEKSNLSMFKVCILAAGRGSRCEELTDNFSKVLLPVNGRAIISHLLDNFSKDTKFVVAIGYQGQKVKEYLLNSHPGLDFTFVEVDKVEGPGSGPGYSLLCCEPYLQEPFVAFPADNLFITKIDRPENNWVGVVYGTKSSDYCSFDCEFDPFRVKRIFDKTLGTNQISTGIIGINDYQLFWSGLRNSSIDKCGELQLSDGLQSLIPNLVVQFVPCWSDLGTKERYLSVKDQVIWTGKVKDGSNNEIDFDKPNERIYFDNGRVIKYFADKNRTTNRLKKADILKGLVPDINQIGEYFYSYDFVEGETLYNSLKSGITKNFLDWCKSSLWKPTTSLSSFKSFEFYHNKTIERITSFFNKNPELNRDMYFINDLNTLSLPELFSSIDWDWLCNSKSSIIHGDLQFDNVVVKPDGSFVLLDWREDFAGAVDNGDLYYDLAKIYGGLLFPYNQIKKGDFDVEEVYSGAFVRIVVDSSITEAQKEFFEFVKQNDFDMKKIGVLTSLIFLNMSPLHSTPFDKFLFYSGIYYLQKYLNENQ